MRTGLEVLGWLLLVFLLSRVLSAPTSRPMAASADQPVARKNTSFVLEGVGLADDPVVTLKFANLDRVTLEGRQGIVAPQPPGMARPTGFVWDVQAPPGSRTAVGVQVGVTPQAGADLRLGSDDNVIRLSSDKPFEIQPAIVDPLVEGTDSSGEQIDGSLTVDNRFVPQAFDLVRSINVVPAGQAFPAARLTFKGDGPKLVAGAPEADSPEADEGSSSPIAVRSVAQLDETGDLMRRWCGGRGGIAKNVAMDWAVLWQMRIDPQPPRERCEPGYLTASVPVYDGGTIKLSLTGPAFTSGPSELYEKLKEDPVFGALLVGVIAIPGARLGTRLGRLFAPREAGEAGGKRGQRG